MEACRGNPQPQQKDFVLYLPLSSILADRRRIFLPMTTITTLIEEKYVEQEDLHSLREKEEWSVPTAFFRNNSSTWKNGCCDSVRTSEACGNMLYNWHMGKVEKYGLVFVSSKVSIINTPLQLTFEWLMSSLLLAPTAFRRNCTLFLIAPFPEVYLFCV